MALSDADKRTAQFILACRENYSRDQGYNQAAEAVLYLLDCLASAEQELTSARAACGEAAEWIDEQLCWVAQDGEHPETCHECAEKAVLIAKLRAIAEGGKAT